MIQRFFGIIFVVVSFVLIYELITRSKFFIEGKVKNPTKVNYHNGTKYSKLPESLKSTVKNYFLNTFFIEILLFCCTLGFLFFLDSWLLFYLGLLTMLFCLIFDLRYFIKKDWKSISEGHPVLPS